MTVLRFRGRGFTLLELLIVLVVAGLGMWMAVVSIEKLSTQSEEKRWPNKTLQALVQLRNKALLGNDTVQGVVRFDQGTVSLIDGDAEKVVLALPQGYAYRPVAPTSADVQKLPLVFFSDGSMGDAAFTLTGPGQGDQWFRLSGLAGKIDWIVGRRE